MSPDPGSTTVSLLDPMQKRKLSKKPSTISSSKPTKKTLKKRTLKPIVHGLNPKSLLRSLNFFTILNWTLSMRHVMLILPSRLLLQHSYYPYKHLPSSIFYPLSRLLLLNHLTPYPFPAPSPT